jgi:cobalt-zinc-cadmium resistance protein CzcA
LEQAAVASRSGPLSRIIELSLRNRFFVVLAAALLVVSGIHAITRLPLDAFPDTTPVQAQVNTVAPSLGPEEVEQQITVPLEIGIGGLPGLREVRSISKFGLSQVTLTFEDEVDIYFARQLVGQRLQDVELSAALGKPKLGPVATGLGEVYHYLLARPTPEGMTDEANLTELRTLQDWVIQPQLRTVPGVAEVNTWGGFEKQYHVEVDPTLLAKHGLTLEDVERALRKNNVNVGGGTLEQGGEAQILKGVGIVTTLPQISDVLLASVGGIPIRIRDVAAVRIGHEIRRAAVTAEGEGECVLGLGFLRMGENSRTVTQALDRKLEEAKASLPPDSGVRIAAVYERTHLVDKVLATVQRNLLEGALLVIAVLFAFLGNFRAGLIVASAIPLSLLFAGNLMLRFGIAGSLMSLGAIDFGLIVDSSVVMVENCARRLSEDTSDRAHLDVIRDAAVEVRRPTMFGELIIMIVYLPILTLEGVEGKLFRPMALTVIFALSASLVLSLTLLPVLASLCLPRRMRQRQTLVDRGSHALFQPVLRWGLRHPRWTLLFALVVTAAGTGLGFTLGTEFLPRLNEGSIIINTVRLSGVSLEESVRYGTRIEKLLRSEFPDEIEKVWTRTGTPEVATDPMGVELSDVFIQLTPQETWKRASSQEELVRKMAERVQVLPGMRALLTQPIEMRVNEMIAGIRGDVGLKIYGDDLEAMKSKAKEVEAVLKQIPGAADVSTEQVTGQPVLEARVIDESLSRYGVDRSDVLAFVEAAAGIRVGEIREGPRRFPLVLKLAGAYQGGVEELASVVVPTATGQRIPLTSLVTLESTTGPSTIAREWGRRRILVQCNVRGRDVGSFVQEAQARIKPLVEYPFSLGWGGQFEHFERARQRLYLVVPMALFLILSLLYLSFGSIRDALIVFSCVLFARAGGILGLWVRGMPFSISAGVGFVALAGAAMLEGIILVSYIRRRMAAGLPKREAIEQARLQRLRPVLMTGLVAALGFVPMAFSTGVGAEVQRPLATVVVFGIAADTVLTLLVLPVLYLLFGKGPARGDEA